MNYYGTLIKAEEYFSERLHADVWAESSSTDRPKALQVATKIIDSLRFVGRKEIPSQGLEFPRVLCRNAVAKTPIEIEHACYEIAYALLDGRDPEADLENLAVTSNKYDKVTTEYSRAQAPLEHIANGVPSLIAWKLLRPFLQDSDSVRLDRVS